MVMCTTSLNLFQMTDSTLPKEWYYQTDGSKHVYIMRSLSGSPLALMKAAKIAPANWVKKNGSRF